MKSGDIMLITVFAAMLLAKIKGYKLKPLFSSRTIYPLLIAQMILVFFQFSIFLNTFYFIRFAAAIQSAIILSFLFPAVVYRLYQPAVAGAVCVLAGSLLNRFVIAQNGGKMPVFPSLSYLTGYISPEFFGAADTLHVLGGEATRFWFLSDYIDVGYSILSPGDLLIHFFTLLMLYYTIKAANLHDIKSK